MIVKLNKYMHDSALVLFPWAIMLLRDRFV